MSLHLESLRAGKPGCPSDLSLDQLHAGELAPSLRASVEAHAQGCPDCTARLAERQAGFAAYPALDERKLLARVRQAAPGPSLWERLRAGLGGLTGLAAVGALVVGVLAVQPRGGATGEAIGLADPGVRQKGGLGLHVFRLRGERAEAALSGDRFAPGDRLRFVADLPQGGFVQVVGVEQSGALYTAWPLDAQPAQLAAGQGLTLPGAVTLDGSAGRETLYLVACPQEPPRCTVAARSAADDARKATPTCQAACALTPFVLEKGP